MPFSRTTFRYVGTAVLLGVGGVIGLAIARRLFSGVAIAAEAREHAFFYLYTTIATTLVLSVVAWLLATEHDALARSRDRYEALSRVDGLTHLANARAFRGHYRRLLAASRRSGEPLSLLMIDVDDLKGVNDRFGHEAGSEVLRHVSATLQRCKRTGDVAARWGGDEFAVLLPGAHEDAACRLAESILAALRVAPLAVGGTALRATVTIGVATVGGGSNDLFERADSALLSGKRAGRNRISVSGSRDGAGPSGAAARTETEAAVPDPRRGSPPGPR